MSGQILEVLSLVLLPMIAIVIGGAITTFFTPGPILRSALQHLAAGVIFYAVAVELLPKVISHRDSSLAIGVGFTAGVAFLLVIEELTARGEKKKEAKRQQNFNPTGFLVAVALDVTLDGLLIGLAFAAGAKEGIILAIALTIEDLFLGLSTALILAKGGISKGRILGINTGLALLTGTGGVLGATILGNLSGALLEGVLSFGIAALMFLVTEELLVEAHSGEDTPFPPVCSLPGFCYF